MHVLGFNAPIYLSSGYLLDEWDNDVILFLLRDNKKKKKFVYVCVDVTVVATERLDRF